MLMPGKECLFLTKNLKQCLFIPVRLKKTHWKTLEKQNKPIQTALGHFDDFYKNVFGKKWHSIRLALLSPHKYCAIVNNYSDTNKIMTSLENEGALNLRNLFELQTVRLAELRKSNARECELQKIYKLDKKLDALAKNKHEEELESLYPESSQKYEIPTKEKVTVTQQPVKRSSSLEDSMASADIDWTRQIDPASGVDAGGLYEYIPATKLKGKEDWVPESQHYSYYSQSSQFPVDIQKENKLHFPEHLQVYIFENGNIRDFKPSRTGTTGVSNYYLMDGSSLFPVLALNLAHGDTVLDMCAAPGGKSVACLQTLCPDVVVCNDFSESRTKRIKNVMNEYFFDWEKKVKITQTNAIKIQDTNTFSKILVDVPCTTDRHSVMENDNNIFRVSRLKERIRLPELQAEILFSALKLVKVGGTVVYSTCSLSPVQNDGVVHMALKKIWEETSVKLVIIDMAEALIPFKEFFCIGNNVGLRYGHIILPYLPANFGPLYFCKIIRTQGWRWLEFVTFVPSMINTKSKASTFR